MAKKFQSLLEKAEYDLEGKEQFGSQWLSAWRSSWVAHRNGNRFCLANGCWVIAQGVGGSSGNVSTHILPWGSALGSLTSSPQDEGAVSPSWTLILTAEE